jgi:hypothetical protein
MTILKPETIKAWLHEAQDLDISPSRATEIGKLIEPLANMAREAARNISFDAEPDDFLRTLNRWARDDDDPT